MSADHDDEVFQAATLYYLQDQTMDAIGRYLGTSRSTVSRMLKQARQTGLVEITLHPRRARQTEAAQAITATFGVQAYVVPVTASAPPERLEQVAQAAARLLATWFDSDMVLGVAWGITTTAISRHLPTKPVRGSVVVQLNGAANQRTAGTSYAGGILARFGTAFEAAVVDFPVPAFFDYPQTKDLMWRERSIRRVLDLQEQADIALFSVGAIGGRWPSHVYSAGYLEPDDVARLDAEGVVGDVCTVFLRADGSHADIDLNHRATGPTPEQLKLIDRRVCVVAGESKLTPLLAALRAGVVTDLVIDADAATRLARLL